MLSLFDSEVITIAVKGLWSTAPLYSEKSLNCLPLRLDYQPLFGKMNAHLSPERAAGRVRFLLLV